FPYTTLFRSGLETDRWLVGQVEDGAVGGVHVGDDDVPARGADLDVGGGDVPLRVGHADQPRDLRAGEASGLRGPAEEHRAVHLDPGAGGQDELEARCRAALLGLGGDRDVAVRQLGGEDRKSTRLNSSHVKISYAVFCLKKKK